MQDKFGFECLASEKFPMHADTAVLRAGDGNSISESESEDPHSHPAPAHSENAHLSVGDDLGSHHAHAHLENAHLSVGDDLGSHTSESTPLRIGDIVVYTSLMGRPCPQLGYICAHKDPKVATPAAGYVSPRDTAARVRIAPLTLLPSGRWVSRGNKRNIITRVQEECFRIPERLADLKITLKSFT